MFLTEQIKKATSAAIIALYQKDFPFHQIQVNITKPEFEGDYTVVLFGFLKILQKNPESLGNELGSYLLQENSDLFVGFNVVKGFLNLIVKDTFWLDFIDTHYSDSHFGKTALTGERVMVEYSSPNTNKPLHLGHLRNNFLGKSIANILSFTGKDVIKTCIVNDRGIHICKSMIAWQLFANGATPASTNMKGDHFVGDYYVLYNEEYKKQVAQLITEGLSTEEAEKKAPILLAAQQMLLAWEK
ncbi:MAG: arginine--tRNA ligase, partial [Chitinophagaceae bacterium]|nr:arginine--tRNA ligase [Chitinophagaceae bacterium]